MSASSEREHFETALFKNEDDNATRMAFADWLDERGEHEEADRHRRWPAAKKWIVDLCERHRPTQAYREEYGDGDYEYEMLIFYPYEKVMERALNAVADADEEDYFGFFVGERESLCDDLREHAQEFWKNWTIITGIQIEQSRLEMAYFTCAC